MRYPIRRAAACVLAAAVLSACGGGGEPWNGGEKASAIEARKSDSDAKSEDAVKPIPVMGCSVELYGDSGAKECSYDKLSDILNHICLSLIHI